jgi:hypothetical protein
LKNSIWPFFSREIRKYPFHHLLTALAFFDLCFIATAVPVHILPVLNVGWLNDLADTWVMK